MSANMEINSSPEHDQLESKPLPPGQLWNANYDCWAQRVPVDPEKAQHGQGGDDRSSPEIAGTTRRRRWSRRR
jgi:hypothetical protein